MSSLRPGDAEMHYSDRSHRWIAPVNVDQEVWEAELAAHLDLHRTSGSRPVTEQVADAVIAAHDAARRRRNSSRTRAAYIRSSAAHSCAANPQ